MSGTVVTERNQPVSNASVVVKRAGFSERVLASGVTDSTGRFRFELTVEGDLVVAVSHVAYAPVLKSVAAHGATSVLVILSAMVLPHAEVEVIASRGVDGVTPLAVSNIDAAALSRMPVVQDIPAQIEQSPSITQYSENGNGLGYTYLRLRGFDQKRIAVSINGIPQNDPESFDVFWINFFDLQNSISDIQIQRGASGSFYGSTGIGGGINIVAMPYSSAAQATATVGYGSFNTRMLSIEGNSGLVGRQYILHGRLSRTLSDGYRDWSWANYWRFFAGIRRVAARSVLTLQAYGGPQEDALAYTGIPKDANKSTVVDDFGSEIDRRYNLSQFTRDVEKFRQPHVELHHEWSPEADVVLTQRVFWIRGVGHFDFDGSFRSANYLRLPEGIVDTARRDEPLYAVRPDVGVLFRAALDQWQIGWQPSIRIRRDRNVTSLGGELRLHRSLRWGRVQDSQLLPTSIVGDSDVRVYSVRGEKSVASLFGSHLLRPSSGIAVQADGSATILRYRVYDEDFFETSFSKGYLFVNPRIGITVFPEARSSAFVNASYTSREPRLKTLYDGEEAGAGAVPQFETFDDGEFDYSRPFVKPESVADVELGFRSRGSAWVVSATAYHMYFFNEIVPSGGLDQFGIPRTGNASRTRHAGLELESTIRIAAGLDLWGNTSIARNRFIEFDEFVADGGAGTIVSRDGNPVPGSSEFILNAGVRYTTPTVTAGISARHRGRSFIDSSGGRDELGAVRRDLSVDPFTLIDATLRVRSPRGLLNRVSGSLDITNVLNRKVLAFGNSGFGVPQFFPAATRHVFLSLQYELR